MLPPGGPPGMGNAQNDPSTQAFVAGLFTGAGMREISQQLGLSRKRQGLAKGQTTAQPTSSSMLQGQLGDLDKVMLLARLQQAMQGNTSAAGPSGPPGLPPGLGPPRPPMGMLPPPMPPGPPGGGPPLPPPPMPGGPPMPMLPPMPPGGGGVPGGPLQTQLLQQLLASAGP